MRGRMWRSLVAFIGAVIALAGCESLRLHDAGRLEMAKGTTTLAAELSTESGGVFAPMEENLETVWTTQTKLRRLTDQHELDAFKENFNRLGPDRIAKLLVEALDGRNAVLTSIAMRQAEAMRAINEGLDRQRIISEVLKDTPSPGSAGDALDTLNRLDRRLKWIGTVLDNLHSVQETVG